MKPVAEQTLYEILEVPFDAPESVIVEAWERAEALYGPGSLSTYTLISPEETAALGARLEEALHVLLDPIERQRYDARVLGRPGPKANGSEVARAPGPPALPPIIPPLAEAAGQLLLAAAGESTPRGGAITRVERAAPANGAPAIDEPAIHEPAAEEPVPEEPAIHEPSTKPLTPSVEVDATAVTSESRGTQRPAVILLSAVAAAPSPLPLVTPAPVSPPFAAVAEPPVMPALPPAVAAPPAPRVAPGPPPVENALVVPEGTPFTGDVLRRAREARGLSVPQLCERTKIARYHLENLEADRHDKLPAVVYLRGILIAISKELRLDGQKVARSYLEGARSAQAKAR